MRQDLPSEIMQPGNTVYFVGAGTTRADFPGIPLMEDLLDQILRTGSAHGVLRLFADCQFVLDGFEGFVRRLAGES